MIEDGVVEHRVGNYVIEYPTMCNGGLRLNSFFVIPQEHAANQRSQFGIFYGNERWASDFPEELPNYVKNWLEKRALNHEWKS